MGRVEQEVQRGLRVDAVLVAWAAANVALSPRGDGQNGACPLQESGAARVAEARGRRCLDELVADGCALALDDRRVLVVAPVVGKAVGRLEVNDAVAHYGQHCRLWVEGVQLPQRREIGRRDALGG